jgi:hypothetical protein
MNRPPLLGLSPVEERTIASARGLDKAILVALVWRVSQKNSATDNMLK